jgi:hypothetical protein
MAFTEFFLSLACSADKQKMTVACLAHRCQSVAIMRHNPAFRLPSLLKAL